MKSLLLATALLVSFSGFSAHASNPDESHYSSATLIYLDGSMRENARTDEGSDFAGQCLLENPKNPRGWDIVDDSVCAEQTKALSQHEDDHSIAR